MEKIYLLQSDIENLKTGGEKHFSEMSKKNGGKLILLNSIFNYFPFNFLKKISVYFSLNFFFTWLDVLFVYIQIKKYKDSNVVISSQDFALIYLSSLFKSVDFYCYDLPWTYYRLKTIFLIIDKKIFIYFLRKVNVFSITSNMNSFFCNLRINSSTFNIYDNYKLDSKISKKNNKELGLLFCGSIRFKKLTNSIFKILSSDFELFYGGKMNLNSFKSFRINNLGFLSPSNFQNKNIKNNLYGLLILSERYSELSNTSIPSKIGFYLSLNIPIIAIVPENCPAWKLISSNNIGICLSPKNLKSIDINYLSKNYLTYKKNLNEIKIKINNLSDYECVV